MREPRYRFQASNELGVPVIAFGHRKIERVWLVLDKPKAMRKLIFGKPPEEPAVRLLTPGDEWYQWDGVFTFCADLQPPYEILIGFKE